MKKVLVFIGVALICLNLTACRSNAATVSSRNLDGGAGLTKEQKQKDVDYMMDMLAECYIYQDIKPEAPAVLFQKGSKDREKATAVVVNTKDDIEYYYETSKFLGSLGNLHTVLGNDYSYVYLDNPEITEEEFIIEQKRWQSLVGEYQKENFSPPFFTSDYDTHVVTKSVIPEIKTGDRVISVNGKNVEEYKTYESWGAPFEAPMKLEVIDTQQKTRIVSYDGKAQELYLEAKAGRELFEASISDDKGLGYLRVPGMRIQYQEQIDDFFEAAKDCLNIIVDIRNNGGGEDAVMSQLIAHISKQETDIKRSFRYNGVQIVRKGWPEEEYRQRMAGFVFFPEKSSLDPAAFTAFSFWNNIDTKDIEPFRGNVYVLQNKWSYSSSGCFLQEIHSADLDVTTVGTPSGSAGAWNTTLKLLPESKLMFRMASCMYIDENGGIDEIVGVAPDYEVEPASAEVVAKYYSENPGGDFATSEYDPQFQRVMELIEAKK